MASQYDDLPKTPNLRLNRPTYDNNADIEALNENFDILDEEVAANKANRIINIVATANESEFKYTRQNGTTKTVTLVKKSKKNIVDMIYPVGSIYMSVSSTSPATLFGGTWVALNEGRVLIGAGSKHAAGTTGGEETHKITVKELPSHNHTATVTAAGKHNHGGNTGNAGAHDHARGSMNITGSFGADDRMENAGFKGAFSKGAWADTGSEGRGGGFMINFDASRAWTGKTSAAVAHAHSITQEPNHTHTVTINSTGGNTAMNNMQPYLAVYMWKRTA